MEVLITGVAGFIGSNLADYLLSKGIKVVGIDNYDNFYSRAVKEQNLASALNNPNFSFYEVDITDSEVLNSVSFNGTTVIHLAAKAGVRPSIENPKLYVHNNITGTQTLLEWMKVKGIKNMVFASSSSVYGNNEKTPFAESDNVDHPISPYALTKKACELLNFTYFKLYGISSINLRFFTVYGERQRPDLAIHKFVKLISAGNPIEIYGAGQTGRDYTYVGDIVRGIEQAMALVNAPGPHYEIINLGNSSPVKLMELVNTISELLNTKPVLNYLPPQPGDVEFTYADVSKAAELLHFRPSTPLKTGLQNFISWFQATNTPKILPQK